MNEMLKRDTRQRVSSYVCVSSFVLEIRKLLRRGAHQGAKNVFFCRISARQGANNVFFCRIYAGATGIRAEHGISF